MTDWQDSAWQVQLDVVEEERDKARAEADQLRSLLNSAVDFLKLAQKLYDQSNVDYDSQYWMASQWPEYDVGKFLSTIPEASTPSADDVL